MARSGADGLEGQLEHIQREAIIRALEQTRYNKTKAAELLGMTFRQLQVSGKEAGDRVTGERDRATAITFLVIK